MKFTAEVKDKKIIGDRINEYITRKGDWTYQVSIRKGNIRTLDQNNYYRMLVTLIWSELWYFPDEVHLLCKALFGKETTTDNTRAEFGEYVDSIRNYFLIEFGIVTPDAEL